MKNIFKIILLVLIASLLVLNSCKLVHVNQGVKDSFEINELLNNIELNSLDYDNLSYSFSANFVSGANNQSFSGNLRLVRDSLIWISLRSLSFEGARLIITKDTAILINRLDKSYISESIKDIQEKLQTDLNLALLESILSNKFFLYPEPENKEKAISELNLSADSSHYSLSSSTRQKNTKKARKNADNQNLESKDSVGNQAYTYLSQRIKILPDLYKVSEVLIENSQLNQTFYVKYYDFVKNEEKYFPSRIDFEVISPKFDVSLFFKLETPKINEPKLKCPIKIPSKYNKTIIQ